ncbi:MAG: response regulator [bacterium]
MRSKKQHGALDRRDGTKSQPTNPAPAANESEGNAVTGKMPSLSPSSRSRRQPVREVAVLTVLQGPQSGKRFRLTEQALIGRGENTTVPVFSEDVSRAHARIRRTDTGTYVVEDLNSRNGTRVNDKPVALHRLEVGDRIGVGSETELLFSRRSVEEEELLELQKLESLGRLAGGIAHDFNNLLSVFQGNTELVYERLQELLPPDDSCFDALRDMKSAARRASDLTTQLLGFARRGKWSEAPVDLSQVVIDVQRIIARTFDRSIRVSADVEPELVVIGDRSQLFQMLMNLCFNSRDAMPDGGTLTLAIRRIEHEDPDSAEAQDTARSARTMSQVQLSVSDTGVGMEAEVRGRLFEPFFTTKPMGRGTGLGLSLVYGIVTSHGGDIAVQSAPGRGTTFTISLPPASGELSRVDSDALITPQAADLHHDRKSDRGEVIVLVVDDEELVRSSVGRMVRQLGYQVESATDGVDALRRYQELKQDSTLVMLDLVMPNMGGEQALRELKKLDPGVKILIMSGHSDDARVESLRDAGAAGFLPKPFSIDKLNVALNCLRSFA